MKNINISEDFGENREKIDNSGLKELLKISKSFKKALLPIIAVSVFSGCGITTKDLILPEPIQPKKIEKKDPNSCYDSDLEIKAFTKENCEKGIELLDGAIIDFLKKPNINDLDIIEFITKIGKLSLNKKEISNEVLVKIYSEIKALDEIKSGVGFDKHSEEFKDEIFKKVKEFVEIHNEHENLILEKKIKDNLEKEGFTVNNNEISFSGLEGFSLKYIIENGFFKSELYGYEAHENYKIIKYDIDNSYKYDNYDDIYSYVKDNKKKYEFVIEANKSINKKISSIEKKEEYFTKEKYQQAFTNYLNDETVEDKTYDIDEFKEKGDEFVKKYLEVENKKVEEFNLTGNIKISK